MPTGTKGELYGVSCVSTKSCTAVGHFQNGVFGAFGDEWNGSSWALASIKANEGDKNGNLWNVSCFEGASVRCFAVGAYGDHGVGKTLVETSNKGVWSQSLSLNSGTVPELYGVSCVNLEFCLATGHHETGSPLAYGIMAEAWEGTAWSLLSPPENPGGQKNGKLWAASCVTATTCKAVGGWGKVVAGKAFGVAGEETFNGEVWTSAQLPEPPTAEVAELYDVSCKKKEATGEIPCLAVGGWKEVESGKEAVFTDIWNGKKWELVIPGVPKGALSSEFKGVSCVAVEQCELVGNYRNSSGTTLPLAESWNGTTFTIQETKSPLMSTSSQLEGVSCVAVEECHAVGYYSPNFESPRPFGLHL